MCDMLVLIGVGQFALLFIIAMYLKILTDTEEPEHE